MGIQRFCSAFDTKRVFFLHQAIFYNDKKWLDSGWDLNIAAVSINHASDKHISKCILNTSLSSCRLTYGISFSMCSFPTSRDFFVLHLCCLNCFSAKQFLNFRIISLKPIFESWSLGQMQIWIWFYPACIICSLCGTDSSVFCIWHSCDELSC